MAEDPDKTEIVSTPAAAEKPTLPAIPDHRLLRCIGRGSYGEVWLARNVMGTYRAVKVVYRANFQNDRPYEREFDGIQKFEPVSRSHEGLVDILHVGRNDEAGYFYYVMELGDDLVSGQQIDPDRYQPKTLQRQIQQRGRLPVTECLPISLSLTSGLGHLHQQGLVHRDIKPSNIIFVNGVPKLADIGLVCGTEATHSYVGTEGFIPPEGPGTPQADLYGLGKVFYEMTTGKDRQDFPDLPTDLRGEEAEREALLEFNEVLVKACASKLSERYQTAQEMERDLVSLQGGKSVKRQRAARRRWAAAKLIGVVAVGAALVFGMLPLVKRGFARRPVTMVEKSIAVLPFLNESPSPEDELNLSEAIPDEVISALTQIAELKVAPPTLSFAFKGRSDDWSKIGAKLKVGAVLGGKFRKSGTRLHLNIELISTADGYLRMSRPYHIDLKELATLHNQIARQVAAALKVSLATEEVRHLARGPTDDPEAWKSYLLGRQHWNQRMKPGEIQIASNYFAQAIDPDDLR